MPTASKISNSMLPPYSLRHSAGLFRTSKLVYPRELGLSSGIFGGSEHLFPQAGTARSRHRRHGPFEHTFARSAVYQTGLADQVILLDYRNCT